MTFPSEKVAMQDYCQNYHFQANFIQTVSISSRKSIQKANLNQLLHIKDFWSVTEFSK